MKSIIVNENGTLEVKEVTKPQITAPSQVLVKVAYSGVCGSDIPRIFHHGAHYYPITLGHEFSGEIVEMGSQVKGLAIGDLISCVPLLPCFACEECKNQYYSLCKNYTFVGSRLSGGFAEYVVMDYRNAFKLAKEVSPLEGAFFEPMTVGMHGILLANGCKDKHVTVIGAGTIGLLSMQSAKAMDAKHVTVIDINEERLALAKELGADQVFNSGKLSAAQISEELNAKRFNQLILETAGAPATVCLSIEIAGPRAQVVLIGTLHNDLNLSEKIFGLILRKELLIMGSWMNYSSHWPGKEWELVSTFFAEGKVKLDKLIAGVGDPDTFIDILSELKGKPMSGKILLKL